METDAKCEDSYSKPIRIEAFDVEDLQVLSALCQDAVVSGEDILWQPKKGRLTFLLNRFRWEEQFDEPERGFSFQKDGPLDMRFNRNQELTCSDIIENYSESELSEILWKLGEEEESRRIAKFIVERREVKKFKSTTDLANVIKLAKRKRTKKHSATKSFQALRMAVNSELESLSKCLEVLKNKLKKSGKIVVISFHSLEDRIAKQSFKTQSNLVEKKIPIFNDTTKEKFTVSKVLLPTNDEISMNPRSRSAKMRVIKKL